MNSLETKHAPRVGRNFRLLPNCPRSPLLRLIGVSPLGEEVIAAAVSKEPQGQRRNGRLLTGRRRIGPALAFDDGINLVARHGSDSSGSSQALGL